MLDPLLLHVCRQPANPPGNEASSIFGNTNITSNLQVHGGLTVATASMFTSDVISNGNVHADHLNEKSGAYLDKSGSV